MNSVHSRFVIQFIWDIEALFQKYDPWDFMEYSSEMDASWLPTKSVVYSNCILSHAATRFSVTLENWSIVVKFVKLTSPFFSFISCDTAWYLGNLSQEVFVETAYYRTDIGSTSWVDDFLCFSGTVSYYGLIVCWSNCSSHRPSSSATWDRKTNPSLLI